MRPHTSKKKCTLRKEYPAEEGLRHVLRNRCEVDGQLRKEYPAEEGLRLWVIRNYLFLISPLRKEYPAEEGLRRLLVALLVVVV